MKVSKFQVLLYYKYIQIPNPESIRDEQRKLCESLSLKGRIIVAKEGINGTIEGKVEHTEKYIKLMAETEEFKDISFKKSQGTGQAFPKLSIKVRPEIVAGKLPELDPNKVSGRYITSEQLHQWFEEKREFYIVDMRNDYEQESGYFKDSILSGIHNFYDLPQILPKIDHLKNEQSSLAKMGLPNKPIVTVCTGGVRCEKASGFLVQNGFNQVYQLKDGIQTYMEKYPNKYFKGKLYVFDNRLTIGFNTEEGDHEIVGRCRHCQKPSDNYVNCAEDFCHLHYICCDNCKDAETNLAFCKKECKEKYLNQKFGFLNFE